MINTFSTFAVNRLRTIRMKLKVKFPVEVTVDLNDPDQNLEVKATVLQQVK